MRSNLDVTACVMYMYTRPRYKAGLLETGTVAWQRRGGSSHVLHLNMLT